jgi:hypothetical protein
MLTTGIGRRPKLMRLNAAITRDCEAFIFGWRIVLRTLVSN